MTRLGLLIFATASALAVDARAAPAAPAPAERGRQVFDYWCAACHGAGAGRPGTSSLAFKYKGDKPALLEERTDLTPEVTRFFVRNGVSVMPFFRKVEISDPDLEALAAYLARTPGRAVP